MNKNSLEQTDAERAALERWIKWVNLTPKIALGVLGTLLLAYVITFWQEGWPKKTEAWGQLGDYIGGLLNPLVAGFALMALVVSVRLQKAELAATRKELKNSRLAMEEQGKTAEQQRREQRFFDFLTIYRSTVDSIEFEVSNASDAPIALKGKRAFKHLTSRLRTNPFAYITELFETGEWEQWLASEQITKTQSRWNASSPVLDHYFRIVFTLLREAEHTLKDDRWRYMKLLRAQLSRDEINLLAMNLLFDEEGKKMRPLVERYGMLKHMPANILRKLAERELPPCSFGQKWATNRLLTPRETPHAD